MGKSKRRILSRKPASLYMTREMALQKVAKRIDCGQKNEAEEIISLFGLCGEELCEAGLCWEDVKSFSPLVLGG